MRNFKNAKTIVIKVGTSTLTHLNGTLNLKRIEEMVRAIADIRNEGKDVVLVTSGAIGVGVSRLKLGERPKDVKGKQACAAVGQCLLMAVYDRLFGEYGHTVGQVLLTKDVITNSKMNTNAGGAFTALFEFGVIPIVNENDTVSTDEIMFGDNDTLSAYVSNVVGADLLIMLTDVDGLYDRNPNEEGAKLIHEVNNITDDMKAAAGGAGTSRGTGGMITKFIAAEIAAKSNTKVVIIGGNSPALIYDVLQGKQVGTYFNLGEANK